MNVLYKKRHSISNVYTVTLKPLREPKSEMKNKITKENINLKHGFFNYTIRSCLYELHTRKKFKKIWMYRSESRVKAHNQQNDQNIIRIYFASFVHCVLNLYCQNYKRSISYVSTTFKYNNFGHFMAGNFFGAERAKRASTTVLHIYIIWTGNSLREWNLRWNRSEFRMRFRLN